MINMVKTFPSLSINFSLKQEKGCGVSDFASFNV